MSSKVKITFIYPIDPLGSKIGGIETFIRGFIKYAPEDFDIELLGTTENKKRPVGKWIELKLNRKKIRCYPVLYIAKANKRTLIPLNLKFALSLLKHPINTEGRILEFHRIEPALPFWAKPNKKLLFVHGNISVFYSPYCESKWRKFIWFYFQLEKRLIGKMERIFVVSKTGVEFYKNLYPHLSENFSFLPTWVDKEIFRPYSENLKKKKKKHFLWQHGFSKDVKIILFVGRLEPPKDPMLLLETFKYIYFKDSLTKLFIIGTGDFEVQMKIHVKKLGLENNVIFLGTLSQIEVAKIMNISDVFLLTSGFEGMSMVALEALGCGLPVVTTSVGEVGLVVKDGISGKIVEEREAEEIGDAVLKVLRNRDKFTTENCIKVIEPYTAKKVLERVYSFHYQLLTKNSSNSNI